MNDEIKISNEARECGEAIGTMIKNGYSLYPAMQRIQLLLNKRDAEIRELKEDKIKLVNQLHEQRRRWYQLPSNPVYFRVHAITAIEEVLASVNSLGALDAAMSNETKGEQK